MTEVLSLRAECAEDAAFVESLFIAQRAAVFATLALAPEALATLLHGQFLAQAADYRRRFPQAERSIVELAGQPIGRLVVQREVQRWRLVDIALLPDCCGRGLGGIVLAELLAAADAAGVALTACVACDNPARRLYARLGFRESRAETVYLELWRPPRGRD